MSQPDLHYPNEELLSADNWLPPTAALALFEPPEGMHRIVLGKAPPEIRVRYGFRVANLGLLIDPDVGSEVLTMPQVAFLPGAPQGFLGLINLRGNLVPLYELRVLLNLGARRPGVEPLVLVFGQGEQAAGIIVEGYPQAFKSLRLLPDLPPLPDALQDHVSAGYDQDGTVWLEFNHRSFFDEACRGIRLGTI
jgi:twitching motility protein PilI